MSCSQSFSDYRGAVALNNMGVYLLERGAYRSALETLKDAIAVMKTVFPAQNYDHNTAWRAEISDKLKAAHKRIAKPEVVQCSMPLEVNSFDDDEFDVMKDSLRYGPSASMFFPVRVAISDMDIESRNIDVESAMLLYNFGIAHLCMSRVAIKASHKLQEGALRLFDLSRSILSSQYHKCEDSMQQTRILLLSASVMNNIVQVLNEQGNIEQAVEVFSALQNLSSAVEQLEEDEPESICDICVRAAAAA
jgi:tetratricopeptide (TPR) repeat protein